MQPRKSTGVTNKKITVVIFKQTDSKTRRKSKNQR